MNTLASQGGCIRQDVMRSKAAISVRHSNPPKFEHSWIAAACLIMRLKTRKKKLRLSLRPFLREKLSVISTAGWNSDRVLLARGQFWAIPATNGCNP